MGWDVMTNQDVEASARCHDGEDVLRFSLGLDAKINSLIFSAVGSHL